MQVFAYVLAALTNKTSRVDVKAYAEGMPKVYHMNEADQLYYKRKSSQLSHEKKVDLCKNLTFRYLNKNNTIENSPSVFIERTKRYITNS